jgi:hypothetical protein
MAITNGKINLTDTTLLTVPNGKRYAVTTIMVCNTQPEDTGGANDTEFDLHLVPFGQTKGDADPNSNKILNRLKVAGADTFSFDTEKIVLEEGDSIVAMSQSPANLVATISYLEV